MKWMLEGSSCVDFVTQRSLYEVREHPSKTYSWVAFMLANICAKLPWSTLMSPTGAVTERRALLFLLIWSFLMFTSTFTHMIIASVDVAENGGNIATLLFSLTILFCSVLVLPSKFPGFWIFMYHVSPFTYLVNVMLSISLTNAPAICSSVEVSVFLSNVNATSQCEFCAITDTNAFLSQVNSFYDHCWRNFGLMWAYVAFNVCKFLY
ncbi:ABC-2 type transporter-domain-containing protein [Lentinula edodes]|uniref:ABC-2 type transporter-domain-containing protein n=1 Tax=Lentinula lateritia TaxID=40482 RepID=A0A9W8ZQW1_9AGAR|nr:ABC-2 type transporter-domain-containing protein [Lentinula edodes]